MTEAETRAAIVAEALTWELTPYHHNGRIKGVGVDCAMLPCLVYHAVGLIPEINPTYPHDWMNHRDEELFLHYVLPHTREITEDELGPGDLIMWKYGRTYSHSAIVIDRPIILHAVMRGGFVLRGDMDRDVDLHERDRRYFTIVGKD